jgi:hypothetical protein
MSDPKVNANSSQQLQSQNNVVNSQQQQQQQQQLQSSQSSRNSQSAQALVQSANQRQQTVSSQPTQVQPQPQSQPVEKKVNEEDEVDYVVIVCFPLLLSSNFFALWGSDLFLFFSSRLVGEKEAKRRSREGLASKTETEAPRTTSCSSKCHQQVIS